ncbi:MAG TPA: class IV adenylate cyclase [Armatimonadota bacterium]|nr:class IV adenylate cyclase [Armatimonadota bacterium]
MRNIELKCRCSDLGAARTRAERLGARDAGFLHQRDVFFPAPDGRLKLRDFGDGTGELIAYRRADSEAAVGSDYVLFRTDEAAVLEAVLRHALGQRGSVTKRRQLYLFRNTRIHLDEVEGLGTFVELETVITGQTEAEAHAELEEVAAALELQAEDRVAQAYVDLMPPEGRAV